LSESGIFGPNRVLGRWRVDEYDLCRMEDLMDIVQLKRSEVELKADIANVEIKVRFNEKVKNAK
jgi:hypothetical protein